MFFCEPCRAKNKWPESLARSLGQCEVCHQPANCFDIPSSRLPDPPSPHHIHVAQGPEYQGETYIWCECLAGDEYCVQGGSQLPDGALFGSEGLTELMAWIAQHTPGVSSENVTIQS